MQYNSQSHIIHLKDVVYFFEHLLYERHLSFHPDDDFNDYVSMETGENTFSKEEAKIYNRLMEESFEVCEINDTEIYSIGLASMRRLIDPSIDDPIEEGYLVRVKGDRTIYRIISIDDNQNYLLKAIEGNKVFQSSRANLKVI